MTLSIEGVSFGYRRLPVLHGVSVPPVEPGTLTVLIGPNAAGKSTLFRCIAGLLVPSCGTIALDGDMQHRVKRRDWNRRVCYLPQSFACQAALSVFDVVLLARKHLQGRRVDDDDVSEVASLLQRLGIEHLADTFVGDLSGGQQQMVSIAQALVRAPRLFLLDEPTSALDLRHQLEIMTTVREVARERGVACIVALHDLNLAARFADTVLLMREGRVIASGEPAAILGSEQVAETYAVDLELHRTERGTLGVAASLRDRTLAAVG